MPGQALNPPKSSLPHRFRMKGRGRIIAEPWREELHAYIGSIARDIGAVALSIIGFTGFKQSNFDEKYLS